MNSKHAIKIIKFYFNLNQDMDDEISITETIRNNSELRGANLWVLIFAILIASIGLNMNSTAVIIGAMLISPMMGPIIGIGLGLSINDFELIKKAFQNLGFAVFVSLFASTMYFLLTPLDQAQTEILARTSPTIFDVFIALAGGLAGMIAATRKIKTNVLPGVAIATALMPPLCTAGYGIATGSWNFFFGAFYLFFINCVFIFIGTFLIVRMMGFKRIVFLNKEIEKKIRSYIFMVITVTVLPSTYLASKMISKSINQRKIEDFIKKEVISQGYIIIGKKEKIDKDNLTIEISTIGSEINEKINKNLNLKLKSYEINDTKIKLTQVGSSTTDIVAIKTAIIQDLYKNNEQIIKDKDKRIELLEQELMTLKGYFLPINSIISELKVLNPNIVSIVLSKTNSNPDKKKILFANLHTKSKLKRLDEEKISEWLRLRTESDKVKIFYEVISSTELKVSTN